MSRAGELEKVWAELAPGLPSRPSDAASMENLVDDEIRDHEAILAAIERRLAQELPPALVLLDPFRTLREEAVRLSRELARLSDLKRRVHARSP